MNAKPKVQSSELESVPTHMHASTLTTHAQAAIKASLGVSTLEPIGTGPQPRATQPSGAAARPAGTKHPRDVAVAAGAGGMVGGVAGGAAGVHQLASPLKRSRLGEGGAVQPSSGPKDHQHEVDWNALYAAGAAQSYCPEAYAKFESLEAVNGDNWLQEAVAAVAATEYPDQTEADPDEVAAPTDPAQTDQQEPYIQADRDPADAAALNNQWADGGAAGGPCGPDLRVLKAQVLAGAKVIDNRTSLEPNLRDWFSEGPADFLRSEAAAPAAGPAAANLGRHSPTQIAPGDHTTPSQPPVVPSKQAGTSLPPHARAQQPGVTHAWTDMRGCAVRARPYQAFERVWWRRLVDGVWHTDAATVFSVDREDTLTPEVRAALTLSLTLSCCSNCSPRLSACLSGREAWTAALRSIGQKVASLIPSPLTSQVCHPAWFQPQTSKLAKRTVLDRCASSHLSPARHTRRPRPTLWSWDLVQRAGTRKSM